MDRFGRRYEVLRTLGHGGMGVVYEVLDRERGARVALKTMRRLDGGALYRFKQEFRALTDVAHPNLIALHELVTENDQTYFTMELIEGSDLYAYVRRQVGETAEVGVTVVGPAPLSSSGGTGTPTTVVAAPSQRRASTCDFVRLRDTFGQLAEGVHALHTAGHLHRDLKPPNVLVTQAGRVVVLDFGLVASIKQDDERTADRNIVGTPEYMSPEQAAGSELSEASDWYSVGVMLYEALTGARPFQGAMLQILIDKQQFDATPPSAIVDQVPEDLATLCMALLRRQPGQRPRGVEILASLARGPAQLARTPTPITFQTMGSVFIGRERHTHALAEAYSAVGSGKTVAVLVRGSSGMGKSSLVKRFVDLLGQTGEAVVLSGRCYEREAVPFKALDSVIDALSRYLRKLKRLEAEALLPREIHSLTRLFPVLQRVEAVSAMPRRAFEVPDPQEVQRRAFAALRELVARIAERRPLVIWIDDLQWGDVDSVGIFRELLRPPEAPPFLLLTTYRGEDAATTPLVKDLLEARSYGTLDVREIEVGPLAREEALELARSLLGGDDAASAAQAAIVAEESHGSPLFVDELVRYLRSSQAVPWSANHEELRLEDVLYQRVASLPVEARRLLEVIAVAGHPLARTAAGAAAELEGETEATALAILRTGRLVRTSNVHGAYLVESFHDRVRETVAGRLAAEVRAAWHRRIALVLVSSEHPDAEALVVHFAAAGDRQRAGEFAAIAAARNVEALAFDRAADLWRKAIELRGLEGADARELRWKLGDALANAGRGAEAAQAYLAALPGASVSEQLELRRRAAEHLLRSGRIDEGMTAIREVLAAVGMKLPGSPTLVLAKLLANQLRLALRGLRFQRRDASQTAAAALAQLDICWSVGSSLAAVRPIAAQVFQKKHLLLALAAGEPRRIAGGIGNAISASATRGPHGRSRTEALVAQGTALADSLGDSYSIAYVMGHQGIAAYMQGRFAHTRERLETAMAILRDHCTGVAWEMAQGLIWSSYALFQLGELAELSRRIPEVVEKARQRGDVYLATNIRLSILNAIWLAADDPERARHEVVDAMAQWGSPEQQLQQYHELISLVQIELYQGHGELALELIAQRWQRMQSAHLLRVHLARVELHHLRGRAYLIAAARTGDPAARAAHLRGAARDGRALAGERCYWSDPLAQLLEAGVLAQRGQRPRAAQLLDQAATGLEAHDMKMWAAAARRARGVLLGEPGRALVAEADALLHAQAVKQPARFVEILVPGFSPA